MASNRKTGKYGSLFLHVGSPADLAQVAKFGDTFDWRFESTVEMHECTRAGEGARRYMPGMGSATFSCRAHITGLSSLLILGDDNLATLTTVPTALPSLVSCAFKLVTLATEAAGTVLAVDNLLVANQQIIQGFGWVSRASIQVPFDADIVEDFEIQVDGVWSFTPTT